MKNYIQIDNSNALSVLIEFFEDSGYEVPGVLKMLSQDKAADRYPIIIYENKRDNVVALKYITTGAKPSGNDTFDVYCDSLDNEEDACFYGNLTYYLDYNVPTLDSAFPDWTWDLNEEDPVAIINGKRYMSEMTLSAAWPDHLCRRVKIDGVYYYCS